MNWIQKDGYITTEGPLRASAKYRRLFGKYQVRVGGLSAHGSADTEEEAKQFGEEQLQIMKRALILSLITKQRYDEYSFGGLVYIIRITEHSWSVATPTNTFFQGTLEECKNYIVSCF